MNRLVECSIMLIFALCVAVTAHSLIKIQSVNEQIEEITETYTAIQEQQNDMLEMLK